MKVTQELECQEVEYDFILNSKDALFLPDLHEKARLAHQSAAAISAPKRTIARRSRCSESIKLTLTGT